MFVLLFGSLFAFSQRHLPSNLNKGIGIFEMYTGYSAQYNDFPDTTILYTGLFRTDASYRMKQTSIGLVWGINDCTSDSTFILIPKPNEEDCILLIDNLKIFNNNYLSQVVDSTIQIFPNESYSFPFLGNIYEIFATGIYSKNDPTIKNYKLFIKRIWDMTAQQIVSFDEIEGTTVSILFIADIDGDNNPDLIINATDNYELRNVSLFLSSKAKKGDLVGLVAMKLDWFDC